MQAGLRQFVLAQDQATVSLAQQASLILVLLHKRGQHTQHLVGANGLVVGIGVPVGAEQLSAR
jgi:hypothetical protein